MRCANPECQQQSHDLFQGTLWELELEVSPDARTIGSEWGFPVCCVPTRYFWLCGACSEILTIRKWTVDGIVFESKFKRPPMRVIVPAFSMRARYDHLSIGREVLVKSA